MNIRKIACVLCMKEWEVGIKKLWWQQHEIFVCKICQHILANIHLEMRLLTENFISEGVVSLKCSTFDDGWTTFTMRREAIGHLKWVWKGEGLAHILYLQKIFLMVVANGDPKIWVYGKISIVNYSQWLNCHLNWLWVVYKKNISSHQMLEQ